jgi:hypothetical protein
MLNSFDGNNNTNNWNSGIYFSNHDFPLYQAPSCQRFGFELIEISDEEFERVVEITDEESKTSPEEKANSSSSSSLSDHLWTLSGSATGLAIGGAYNLIATASVFGKDTYACKVNPFGDFSVLSDINDFREHQGRTSIPLIFPICPLIYAAPLLLCSTWNTVAQSERCSKIFSQTWKHMTKDVVLPIGYNILTAMGGFMAREGIIHYRHVIPQLDTSGHVILQIAQNIFVLKSFQALKDTGTPFQQKTFAILHCAVAVTDGIWMFNTAANCHSVADVVAGVVCTSSAFAGIEGVKGLCHLTSRLTYGGISKIRGIYNDHVDQMGATARVLSSASWYASRGFELLKGAAAGIGLATALDPRNSIRNLSLLIFNPEAISDLFRFDLYFKFRDILANAKQEGFFIWLREWWFNIDPSSILHAACPKQEYFRQMNLFNNSVIPDPISPTAQLNSLVTAPVVEEIFARVLVQDVILKQLIAKLVHKISPQHAHLIESQIYTACRIVLTAALFTFGTDRNSEELIRHLISGIVYGILKENSGILGSIGAHTMSNFVTSIPDLFSC